MPTHGYGLGLLVVLAGCTQVGPDFEKPQAPWLAGWSTPLLEQAGRSAAAPDLRRWWAVFADPMLDALIAEADAHNTNLRVVGLRIAEARAQRAIVQTGRYPQLQQLSAQSLYLKQDQSGAAAARDSVFWQSSVGFDIGWEIDFWGRFSRAIESADVAYFVSRANYADAMLLLRAQVADTYFALRTAEARLDIARENAERQARSLEITERLFRPGENDELDWQQAREHVSWVALRATLIVMPTFLLALIAPDQYMPLIMKAVSVGQQAGETRARDASRELVGSTLLAGLLAILMWGALSLFVHLWMFFLWVLLFALWQARRLYQVVPNRQSPAYWVSCLTTMLILLGQSVQDSAGGQDVYKAFAVRMALFLAVSVYASAMLIWIDRRRVRAG
ncbi:TolC family protein [Pseudomonas sp. FYR_2]|uniref:TolC family protein n=1 Tax=Pseudomonas TaxID=286 RepID=UPI001E395A7E|nr:MULTISPECIES: TolC family protein [Pseudomonas]MCE0908342.1 TolC family protein [Pseudomonas kurunegalensis]WJR56722.1 TolC family protein [Pseudomonas kurunegalensis]